MFKPRNRALCPGLALLAVLCGHGLLSAEADPAESEDPTVVALHKPDQPIDMPAPPSRYDPGSGEKEWKDLWRRVADPSVERGSGSFDFAQMLGEGFRSAKEFKTEKFSSSDLESDMQVSIFAEDVSRKDKKIYLRKMKMVVFISTQSLSMKDKPGAHQESAAKKEPVKQQPAPGDPAVKKKSPKKDGAAAMSEKLRQSLFFGGRMVIEAPETVIDTVSNEARATGNVTISIFQKFEEGKDEAPLAVLSSERMHWRAWSEASTGSREMAIYTCSEKAGAPDPLVTGRYLVPQPDGSMATMLITGRGMIYETGICDLPKIVYDEDGRTAGLSKVAHNRSIFHSDIRVETTATAIDALMPFQAAPEMLEKQRRELANGPLPLNETTITCAGPAIMDLAAIPRVKKTPGLETVQIEPAGPITAQQAAALPVVPLGRRLEFLNGVKMSKRELPGASGASSAPAAGSGSSELNCKHLCMQYPAWDAPNASSYPEYAEAIGGVRMNGANLVPASQSSTSLSPAPDAPFNVTCQRIFFDGLNDNMFLVGRADRPVEVKSAQLDASAAQFNYRGKTGTFTMPAAGDKKLVIHPGALAGAGDKPKTPGEAGGFDLSGGDTIISWKGVLIREVKHLPVPGAPDIIKDIFTLKDSVVISQPQTGTKLSGDKIMLVQNALLEIEYLSGDGGMEVLMGKVHAVGESVNIVREYADKKTETLKDGKKEAVVKREMTKNLITICGLRRNDKEATLFMGGTAIRADKFIIDRAGETFKALGGAVAVVKAAEGEKPVKPPKAEAAGALFKGISFEPGGNLVIQCDGDFSQDGATRVVTIKKNVLICQPENGTQLFADEVRLLLEEAAPDQPAAGAAKPDAAESPAGALFEGKLKSIECLGGVEITTPEQLVQCDRFQHDVASEVTVLAVDDPENDVRIYIRDEAGNQFLSAEKSLKIDGKSGRFEPGGMLLILPYRADAPAPRDKKSSPAKAKAAPLKNTPAPVKTAPVKAAPK
jgi:hypothetical protein